MEPLIPYYRRRQSQVFPPDNDLHVPQVLGVKAHCGLALYPFGPPSPILNMLENKTGKQGIEYVES